MQDDVEVVASVTMSPEPGSDDYAKSRLVLDVVREQLAEQMRHVGALDARAGFILGSASLLTSVLVLYRAPHLTPSSILVYSLGAYATAVTNILPFVGIGTYILVVLTSYMSYTLMRWKITPNPNLVRENTGDMSSSELQDRLIEEMLFAFNANEGNRAKKVRRTRLAFIALAFEITVVALLLIVTNLP